MNNSEMAAGEQIKALIKSHFDEEKERFITLSLQIAANRARMGHTVLAEDIKKIVDKHKVSLPRLKAFASDLQGLIIEKEPDNRLSDLILSVELKGRIDRILLEYRQKNKLHKYGLFNRRKLLLSGPPGTGKTMTASVIAQETGLPFYVILTDKMVTRFMGETSAKLRQVFESIAEKPGVYLFDEFDAIGSERGKDNDVGEMRRVLSSFLQFIEMDESDSIIISATNNLNILDQALFRRFDDVLHYHYPSEREVIELLRNKLTSFKGNYKLDSIAKVASNLSHAEITQACLDAIKEAVLNDQDEVSKIDLVKTIKQRISAYPLKL
ncbi:AAA family ATPase [Spirosoma fluviale]|uniref:ATPase family associated with various cellular activities (AAA) n=1 Tax=Spirosoma fluviale TaxID=1597977 RepID=A0A286G0J7_9BACT|nr:ATP-binding protein [Spirosoma fluviale]SOD88524.1 ATPase family associated with various cellular activities (AAA) [Spirosoma fluviale]